MTNLAYAVEPPLGMISVDGIHRKKRERLSVLQDYDLEFVFRRIEKEGTLSADELRTAGDEFKRYIALHLLGHRGLSVLCKQVDEVWHAFILHTPEYNEFCQAVAGHFIHHCPSDPNEASTSRVADTVRIYKKYFRTNENDLQKSFVHAEADCSCQGCNDCGVG